MQLVSILLLVANVCTAVPPDAPEEQRLSPATFRHGLKQLEMTDLLEYYVREFLPDDDIESALLRRELQLNLYADPNVPTAERLAAAEQATRILQDLIASFPNHEEHLAWRLELARDLVEREAEPYYNNILLRGGTPQDYDALRSIIKRALKVFETLLAELERANEDIDHLSTREFDKLFASGYIERIETLLPRARYFSMWARFYHCLTLQPEDPVRVRELNEIINYLVDDSKLTTIEHKITHYQAQSLLLVGMAYRLVGAADKADDALDQAAEIAANLADYTERHNLRWVVIWANIDRIKNARDRGRFAESLRLLQEYRNTLPPNEPSVFYLQFALAQLEGSVYRAEADTLPPDQQQRREQVLLRSRQPLIALARANPSYQNEIYQKIFELLGDVENLDLLDSFEKNVYVAGLLHRANGLSGQIRAADQENLAEVAELRQQKQAALAKAVSLAQSLLAEDSSLARELHPEVRFNLAVLYHEQGKVAQAIEQFVAVVHKYPGFDKSFKAAEYAVLLAESLYSQADEADRPALRQYLLEAFQTLIGTFPDAPQAKQRQYAFARLLQQEGLYEQASVQFGYVSPDDPKKAEALFHVAECNLIVLKQMIFENAKLRDLGIQKNRTLQAAERFRNEVPSPNSRLLLRYQGESLLISAETHLARPTPDPETTLKLLADFDQAYSNVPELLGRCMRIKLKAYQALGRLDEAAAIIPDYLHRDPANAGATLQSLAQTFTVEIEQALERGNQEEAQAKAVDAVRVARYLVDWASSPESGLDWPGQLALKLQLGDALLRAKQYPEAQIVFEASASEDGSRQPNGYTRNARIIYGLAEALFHNQAYAEALKHYNLLFRETAENSAMWWKAFLREIQCRRRLDQDPEVLYNLIAQKKSFFPNMGGMKREFEDLQAQLHSATQ